MSKTIVFDNDGNEITVEKAKEILTDLHKNSMMRPYVSGAINRTDTNGLDFDGTLTLDYLRALLVLAELGLVKEVDRELVF